MHQQAGQPLPQDTDFLQEQIIQLSKTCLVSLLSCYLGAAITRAAIDVRDQLQAVRIHAVTIHEPGRADWNEERRAVPDPNDSEIYPDLPRRDRTTNHREQTI